jgi:hypothetical protein
VKTRTKKIASDRLKTYLDARKNPSIVLGAVDRYLQLLPKDRDYSYVHPSDLAQSDWCIREAWFLLNGHSPKSKPLRLSSNVVFAEGHAIHDKWQKWLADMGVLWGRWECAVCEESILAWSNEIGGDCPARIAVGRHLWEYKEVPLEYAALNIRGHADGIINIDGDEPFLLEIKSIGPGTLRALDLMSDDDPDSKSGEMFSRISKPLRSHFIQVQIYLHLAQQWKEEVGEVKRAVIVYEHKADQQTREFVVTYNERWTEDRLGEVEFLLWMIAQGREVLCERGGCARCTPYEEKS